MNDIALVWDGYAGDVDLNGLDLLGDDGLETAVVISLGTDRLAEDGDRIPDGSDDRRGWWGDTYADVVGDKIGTRSWLLGDAVTVQQVLQNQELFIKEALQWMIADNIARAVDVTIEAVQVGVSSSYWLTAQVKIHRPNKQPFNYRFKSFWEGK